MARGAWKKRYVKIFVTGWLHGSIRWQMTSEERGVWADFLMMAGEIQKDGAICDNDGRPLPREFLAHEFHIKPTLLNRVINMCLAEGRLEERDDVLWVTNYAEYQSEYERQKASTERAERKRQREADDSEEQGQEGGDDG